MPIKQLQLRGISRTPSDRMTADGGLAEALNMHLDQQETAPTLPPDDITEDIYGEASLKFPVVYIHKMLGANNYIGHTNGTFRAYGSKLPAEGDGMDLVQVGPGEELQHVSSIGNTLIAYTDKQPYYFLFKDGRYHFLGTQIPRPELEVITRSSRNWQKVEEIDIPDETLRTAATTDGGGVKHPNTDTWNNAKAEKDANHAGLLATIRAIWENIVLMINERRQDGIFVAPFFIRYALKLYDGSYIHLSDPILCGANGLYGLNWAHAYVLDRYYEQTGHVEYTGFRVWTHICNLFKVRAKGTYNVGNWSDLVKSIDFFASTPIYTPSVNAPFYEMASEATRQITGTTQIATQDGFTITFEKMQSDTREQTIKDEVLTKGQFYKIKSVDIQNLADMAKLADGTLRIENTDNISGDGLLVQDELPDGFRDGVQYLPENGSLSLNNRLLLIGADELLSRGSHFLNGQVAARVSSPSISNERYVLRYKIVNSISGSVNYVYAHYRDGEKALKPAYLTGGDNDSVQHFGDETGITSPYFMCSPYAWLTYPDTRCTQVEVFRYSGSTLNGGKIVPLEKHPLLQCVYAFLGYGVTLADIMSDSNYANAPYADADAGENLYMEGHNKLFLSEFENPFLFPAGNIITFPDNVVGAASVSTPLSEGQVGDFDLYVFTEGGIRVLSVNNEGTFSGNNVMPTNVSRHVALPGTITPIEQAIIFTTEKGVMLLSGSQVTELSRFMNGRPYALEEDERALIQRSQWAPIVDAIGGGEPFMAFMRNAKAAYDSNGARLIFFNPEKMYQYVYMMETQTWHKILTGVTSPKILNSYPDCLVSHVLNSGPKVFNFSTVLDDAELLSDTDNPVYGVIITRPFDLGEPDIRKVIKNIRIRGKFNREDVQYILLGSFDNIHWHRLHSLRGGSFKLFRVILLCKMSPTERISWIDVDYESRFTNRLR